MSKKNIARTAIEGGRRGSNKWERRESSQLERVNARLAIATAHNDAEVLHDTVIQERRPVYKEFTDKLNPIHRWLDSHVGERWDNVRSLLTAQFDTRTTAGRHILYDHILRDVAVNPDADDFRSRYSSYVVDSNGLLQLRYRRKGYHHYRTQEPVSVKVKEEILSWMGVRRIGATGTKIYWYDPTRNADSVVVSWGRTDVNSLHYFTKRDRYISPSGETLKTPVVEYSERGLPSYRQGKEFSPDDLKFFNSLPEWMRKHLLKTSPLIKETK